jgi:hypothetical protein
MLTPEAEAEDPVAVRDVEEADTSGLAVDDELVDAPDRVIVDVPDREALDVLPAEDRHAHIERAQLRLPSLTYCNDTARSSSGSFVHRR